ncbi:MAG: hypothetical protein PHY72_01030 [Candidatus Pacebacteria bacterium]|nr:hypothetical protein [Candidatus Paceibacterota bacterium]
MKDGIKRKTVQLLALETAVLFFWIGSFLFVSASTSTGDFIERKDILEIQQNLINTQAIYLGLAVTIILATGGLFYVFNLGPYLKKISKQEEILKNQSNKIEFLRQELTTDFQNKIDEKTDDLGRWFLEQQEERIREIDKKFKSLEFELRSETARSLAIICRQANFPDVSFYWFLTAAYNYENLKNYRLAGTMLRSSLFELKKLLLGRGKNSWIKLYKFRKINIEEYLKFFNAEKKYNQEIEEIENMIEKLLKIELKMKP